MLAATRDEEGAEDPSQRAQEKAAHNGEDASSSETTGAKGRGRAGDADMQRDVYADGSCITGMTKPGGRGAEATLFSARNSLHSGKVTDLLRIKSGERVTTRLRHGDETWALTV